MHLAVVRSPGASACPDAQALAAAIARVTDHEVPDTTADLGAATRLDVAFTRESSGYSASLVIDGAQARARTLADTGQACSALAEALAATIAVVLDGLDAEARPRAPAPSATSAPPLREDAPIPAPAPSTGAWTAPPWVERPLTLPSGRVAVDLGVGGASLNGNTGLEANAEMAVGITDRFEIGVRTGIGGGSSARLFDRETIVEGSALGSNASGPSNPELRIRGATIRDAVGELALEVRVAFPVVSDSKFGVAFGVPLAFHASDRVRIDTGAYQLVSDHVTWSVPVDLWLQLTPHFWLGPRTGVVFNTPGSYDAPAADFSVGFGAAYQILPFVDLKAGVLDQAVLNLGSDIGGGFAVQIRIE